MDGIKEERDRRLEEVTDNCLEKERAARTAYCSRVGDFRDAKERALQELAIHGGHIATIHEMAIAGIRAPAMRKAPTEDKFQGN